MSTSSYSINPFQRQQKKHFDSIVLPGSGESTAAPGLPAGLPPQSWSAWGMPPAPFWCGPWRHVAVLLQHDFERVVKRPNKNAYGWFRPQLMSGPEKVASEKSDLMYLDDYFRLI